MSAACDGCGERVWQEKNLCAECGIKVPATSVHTQHSTAPRLASSPKQISFAIKPVVYEEPKTVVPEPPPVPPRRPKPTLPGAEDKEPARKTKSKPILTSWLTPEPNGNFDSEPISSSPKIIPKSVTSPSSINFARLMNPPTYTSAPSSPQNDVVTEDPDLPLSPRSLTRSLPNKPSGWISYTPQARTQQGSPTKNQISLASSPSSPVLRNSPIDSVTNSEIPHSVYGSGIPPTPPVRIQPRISTTPNHSRVESPRSVSPTTGAALIPLNTVNTIAKQGDAKTVPSSENEVILVNSTYNAQSPASLRKIVVVSAVPVKKAPSPESMLMLSSTVDSKRISFNTVVAMAVGHDGSEHRAQIVGFEQREESVDSTKTVTLFKIEVHKDNQKWFVYRRYAQFNKLALKLKEKKVLSSIGLKVILPPKKADANETMQALNGYLITLLSRLATSHYIGNFLQPLQLGDSKPQNC